MNTIFGFGTASTADEDVPETTQVSDDVQAAAAAMTTHEQCATLLESTGVVDFVITQAANVITGSPPTADSQAEAMAMTISHHCESSGDEGEAEGDH